MRCLLSVHFCVVATLNEAWLTRWHGISKENMTHRVCVGRRKMGWRSKLLSSQSRCRCVCKSTNNQIQPWSTSSCLSKILISSLQYKVLVVGHLATPLLRLGSVGCLSKGGGLRPLKISKKRWVGISPNFSPTSPNKLQIAAQAGSHPEDSKLKTKTGDCFDLDL